MYPDTFEIPSEGTRQSISPGTFVKLMFEHAEPQGKVEIRGGAFVEAFKTERMWVEVTGEEGPYLTGKLSNVPAAGNDPDKLHYDKKIYFLPEHVINIASQDELGAEDEEPAPNGDDT